MGGPGTGGAQAQQTQGQPTGGPNVYGQAAGAYNTALAGTQNAMGMAQGMTPQTAQGFTYSPITGGAAGYGAATGQATGYSAATGQATGYNAAQANPAAGYIPAMTEFSPNAGIGSYGTGTATGQGYGAASMNAAQGYDPAQSTFDPNVQAGTARASRASSQGYDPMGMAAARDVTASQFADADISQYMNPYTDNVIERNAADMERARQIQQTQLAGRQAQAGAFGGSRHGVADALTNERFFDQLGNMSANLRNQGFETARDSAFRDIGNNMTAQQANQGADLTRNQFNAAAFNTAGQFGADAANRASLQNSQLATQASLANARNQLQASTTNNQLGLQKSLANQQANNTMLGAQMQNQQAANAANQAAINRAGEFGANAANQASTTNANNLTQAGIAEGNAGTQASLANMRTGADLARYDANAENEALSRIMQNEQQANLANQSALNQAGQFGASAQNAMTGQNLNALNQAGQFGAQAQNAMTGQNIDAMNRAGQFNAGADNAMTQANMAAANQAGQYNAGNLQANSQFNAQQGNQFQNQQYSNMLDAARQMSGLADQGFGFGNDITNQQMRQGALTQQMQQRLIDAARQQYGNYTNAGNLGLSPLQGFVSGNYGGTTTESSSPGLLGMLGAGAGMAGALGFAPFCWVAREVYGADNPEWLTFREWMMHKAPAWLRKAYIKHGPNWAEWIKRNPWSKRVLRPVMDWLKG